MGMFSTREPRKFRRVNIYTSERKDKLDKLVKEELRREGKLPQEEPGKESYKGRFSGFTPRASGRSSRLTAPIAILIVVVLLLLWRYLLMGRF
ncbi:MAG: hypothetical protein SPF56_05475 [Bacteroidaceae bacterium]|nr:hypothetical protein [Prevotellaceae bacterium]MDY5631930.1 hypothetical protein [Bacteroidaceae bacterium]